MPHSSDIRFLLNDEEITLSELPATRTLLDYLRIERRLTGTKEGCAEGDCGACTVLIGRLQNGALRYETVNACIRFLASLNGCHIVTVEHLCGPDGRLHPVQQAMVEHHGSQCGFCTPGFVMSLYALWMETPQPSETQIETALQGNLCRCTGYAPIVRAALAVNEYGTPANDYLTRERETLTARLDAMRQNGRIETGPEDDRAILPADLDDLGKVLGAHPKATIVAGSTDVGLWVTKFLRPISPVVFITHLEELKSVELTDEALTIGAGVTYGEAEAAMREAFPHLGPYWERIAGWQVRNMGAIGGNIASSHRGHAAVLIALGAEVTLQKAEGRRNLALEDFFIDYGEQDRESGDFVASIRIPRPHRGRSTGLQDLEAARRGYFLGRRRVQPHRAAGAHFCRAAGLWRHGGHTETRRRSRGRACRTGVERSRLRGGGRGTFAGFRAALRLARQRRIPDAGRAEPAAPLLSGT